MWGNQHRDGIKSGGWLGSMGGQQRQMRGGPPLEEEPMRRPKES